jgi:hypothetical protein
MTCKACTLSLEHHISIWTYQFGSVLPNRIATLSQNHIHFHVHVSSCCRKDSEHTIVNLFHPFPAVFVVEWYSTSISVCSIISPLECDPIPSRTQCAQASRGMCDVSLLRYMYGIILNLVTITAHQVCIIYCLPRMWSNTVPSL